VSARLSGERLAKPQVRVGRGFDKRCAHRIDAPHNKETDLQARQVRRLSHTQASRYLPSAATAARRDLAPISRDIGDR
jgi:hypothetical protein